MGDLRKLRDHCLDILKWIDDQAGGGGTGTVTSITTGTPGTVTITNASGPVVNIDVTAASGDVTEVQAGTGISVASGTGPIPVVSLNTATTDGLYLKRAAADYVSFSAKAVPSSADVLLPEDSAASGAKKYATLAQAQAFTLSPAVMAPKHWWTAATVTVTGSAINTWPDAGSGAKTWTQSTSTAKATLATDGSGDAYASFDGTSDFYKPSSGSSADWTWLHNGDYWSIAIVFSHPGAAFRQMSSSPESILSTLAGSGANVGFELSNGYSTAAGGYRRNMTVATCLNGATAPTGIAAQASHITTQVVANGTAAEQRDKDVLVMVHLGGLASSGESNASWYSASSSALAQGKTTETYWNGRHVHTWSRTASNSGSGDIPVYNTGSPTNQISLGASGNGTQQFYAGRIYEVVMWQRPLLTREVENYMEYARAAYHLTWI
jgi:hypothetical protein